MDEVNSSVLLNSINVGSINEIKIEVISPEIIIETNETDEITMNMEKSGEGGKEKLEVLVNGGVLNIKEKMSLLGGIFGKKSEGTTALRISVPAGYAGALKIKADNSAVQLAGLKQLSEFRLSAPQGRVSVSQIASQKDFSITMGMGDLQMEDFAAPNMNITGNSGATTLKNCVAQNMKISSNTGALEIASCEGRLRAYSISGGIRMTGHTGGIVAETNTGDIEMQSGEISVAGALSTVGGNIRLVMQKLSAEMKIKSSSGNVHYEITELLANVKARTSGGHIELLLGIEANPKYKLKAGLPGRILNSYTPGNLKSKYVLNLETDTGDITIRTLEMAETAEESVVEPVIEEEPIVAEEAVIEEEPIVAEEAVIEEEPIVAEEAVIEEEPIVAEEAVIEEIIIEEPVAEEKEIIEEIILEEEAPEE